MLIEPERRDQDELRHEGDPVFDEPVQVLLDVGPVEEVPVDGLEPVAGAQREVVTVPRDGPASLYIDYSGSPANR
jgi:hypothetical protein